MNKILLGTAFVGAGLLFGGVAHADTNVYRLYNHNTGEHFYTTSTTEKNIDVSAGWTYEGLGWTAPTTSSTPVYRVYNLNAQSGAHNYTESGFEQNSLLSNGWKYGAIAWYGVAPTTSKPAPGTLTLSSGDYTVGKDIPAGTYNVTSAGATGTDTYLQYSTGAPNYDIKGFYITSKATSINFTADMKVSLITSGNAKTVVFTPAK